MDEEDIKLLTESFAHSAERWTSQLLNSANRHESFALGVAERGFNLILTLTSICAAFLAIVVPLIKGELSPVVNIVIWSFFATATVGIFSLVITIRRDKKILPENFEWEQKILGGYQMKADSIRGDLIDYNRNKDEELLKKIIANSKDYFAEAGRLKEEVKTRKANSEKELSAKIIKILNFVFWFCFTVATVALAAWLSSQTLQNKNEDRSIKMAMNISSQSQNDVAREGSIR